MSELEDKINSILSSPAELEKIMGIARSLSGTLGAGTAQETGNEASPPAQNIDFSSIASMLGNIDPKTLGIITRIMGEYSSPADDKHALLSAIKPYLKEERREKVDQAFELAKLAKLAKIAFSEFSGGD